LTDDDIKIIVLFDASRKDPMRLSKFFYIEVFSQFIFESGNCSQLQIIHLVQQIAAGSVFKYVPKEAITIFSKNSHAMHGS
jgi:hypothetical protein